MLRILRRFQTGIETPQVEPGWRLPDDAIWIELVEPTRDEELAVEQALKLEIPTREEMSEIESSSRLYREGGALFMTAAVLAHATSEHPLLTPVTFVLSENRLVTIRYAEPSSFKQFAARGFMALRTRSTGFMEAAVKACFDVGLFLAVCLLEGRA